VLFALSKSPALAGYVVIASTILQGIEGYLLLPLLQRKAVDMPPALTIAAQVLLAILGGGLGLLLATPLMAAIMVLIKMLYIEQMLKEPIETPVDQMSADHIPPVPDEGRK